MEEVEKYPTAKCLASYSLFKNCICVQYLSNVSILCGRQEMRGHYTVANTQTLDKWIVHVHTHTDTPSHNVLLSSNILDSDPEQACQTCSSPKCVQATISRTHAIPHWLYTNFMLPLLVLHLFLSFFFIFFFFLSAYWPSCSQSLTEATTTPQQVSSPEARSNLVCWLSAMGRMRGILSVASQSLLSSRRDDPVGSSTQSNGDQSQSSPRVNEGKCNLFGNTASPQHMMPLKRQGSLKLLWYTV